MVKFLKNLIWNPEWIPLGIGIIIGFFIGLTQGAEGQEYPYLYEGEPRIQGNAGWTYSVDDYCSDSYKEIFIRNMEEMEDFFKTRFLRYTKFPQVSVDNEWHVDCVDEFVDRLVVTDSNIAYVVEDLAPFGITLGRAHVAWRTDTYAMVNIDIELLNGLDDETFDLVSKHEIAHGAGCAHNTGNTDALMHPTLSSQKGRHVDDLKCFHKLYGLDYTFVDYLGNLFIPSAKDGTGLSGWAVIGARDFWIQDYGVE